MLVEWAFNSDWRINVGTIIRAYYVEVFHLGFIVLWMSRGNDVRIIPTYSEDCFWDAPNTTTIAEIVANVNLLNDVGREESVWPVNTFIDNGGAASC